MSATDGEYGEVSSMPPSRMRSATLREYKDLVNTCVSRIRSLGVEVLPNSMVANMLSRIIGEYGYSSRLLDDPNIIDEVIALAGIGRNVTSAPSAPSEPQQENIRIVEKVIIKEVEVKVPVVKEVIKEVIKEVKVEVPVEKIVYEDIPDTPLFSPEECEIFKSQYNGNYIDYSESLRREIQGLAKDVQVHEEMMLQLEENIRVAQCFGNTLSRYFNSTKSLQNANELARISGTIRENFDKVKSIFESFAVVARGNN